MIIVRLILILAIYAISIQLRSQEYKELGRFALSTNPLMPIMKGIPVVLDLRTGPLIHDFRYCFFWKHKSSNFYDVFNPLNETTTFMVSNGKEIGYALKMPVNIIDETSFLVYLAPQFIYSNYEFSGLPVKYMLKNSSTQYDQEVSGILKMNRYMGMFGIMIFPRMGFYMDAYFSIGMRKFNADFTETIPGTQTELNSKTVDLIKPEKIGEVFLEGKGRISMQSGFRLGLSF